MPGNETVLKRIEEVNRSLLNRFVLVGGVAMALLGSQGITADVDILVSVKEKERCR